MLRGQNFRGRHQRHLIAVLDHDRRRFQRHDRLAASHVAFEQPVHRIGPLEVRRDFREHALLRRRRLERQDALQRLADFFFAHAHGDPALAMFAQPAQRQRELVVEKLLEDQPRLRRAAKRVEQLDAFVLRREMRVEQRLAPRGEAVALREFLRAAGRARCRRNRCSTP